MHKRVGWSLLAAALIAGPAAAQEQSGAIEGLVKDPSGAVLQGAVVSAKNQAGMTASAVTNSSGIYRFPSLPPGKYGVSATLDGFSPTGVKDINLALGQDLKVDLTLQMGAVTEQVLVTAEAPLIDVKQSARFTNIREEFIDKLPKGRDFTTLATQATGANIESRLGGLSIDGSSAAENRYVIDGMETTSQVNGLSGKALITDFVDEVQVKSSGYTAEYGGATGGVINVVTKTGTNRWRGQIGGYFTGDGLEGDERPTLRLKPTDSTQSEYITFAKDSFSRIEPGFSIGGPLKQDKVWLFVGYQPALIDTDRTITFLVDNQTRTYNQTTRVHYSSANLSAQLNDKTRARLSFNLSSSKQEGLLPSRAGTDSPNGWEIDTIRPNYSVSANVDYTASDSLFFSLRGGYFFRDTKEEGRPQGPRYTFQTTNIGLAGVPADLQRATGFASSPSNFETRKEQLPRLNFQFDGNYFVSAGGKHSFKAGVQFDRISDNVDIGESGNRVLLFWNRSFQGQRGPFGYYRVRSNGINPRLGFLEFGDIHSDHIGLFVQDAWTIKDRFTLNLGLRTEREYVPSYFADPSIPGKAIEFGFGDKIAPRLGFAWDVKGDGRWKAYASWGIFYDITKLEMPRGLFGGNYWLEYWYTLDTPNWTNLVGSGCGADCPGRRILGPVDFRHPVNDPEASSIDPALKPYKLQEAVVGIEHELTRVISLSARYVHKQIDRAIEDVGALDASQNEIYTIGNPGLSATEFFFPAGSTEQKVFPKAQRDYDAVEVAFNKRMADNWALRVSYLWSRLYGNYSGLSQSDENGRVSPNVGRNFDYPLMSFNERGEAVYGVLATDRTHQFKTQFIYDFNFGTSAGLNLYVASGVPVTREAAFIPGNNFPIMYLGRNSDGRTPTYSQVDLYLAHAFKLGGDKRLQLNLNVLNVLDQDTAVNRFRTQLEGGAAVNVPEATFYRGINTQALIQQQGIRQDARFLRDSEFQDTRSIRLGVSFLF